MWVLWYIRNRPGTMVAAFATSTFADAIAIRQMRGLIRS
jgi:hypothetical protein